MLTLTGIFNIIIGMVNQIKYPKPFEPFPFFSQIMSSVEGEERWVVPSPEFARGVERLSSILVETRSELTPEELAEKFVRVSSMVHLGDSLRLLRLLGLKNPESQRQVVLAGLGGSREGACWRICGLRMAWVSRNTAIFRVFQPSRLRSLKISKRSS